MKLNKRTLKNFVGIDASIKECFTNGYLFQIKDKIIYSVYDTDIKKYRVSWGYFTESEVNDDFLQMRDKNNILNFAGLTEEEFLKSTLLNKISDINSYNGWYFYDFNEYTKTEFIIFLNKSYF